MRLWHRRGSASATSANRPLRPKWHYLYFALAAFDVFTVCGGLYLSHSIMRIYTGSVEVNQTWAERVLAYSHLGELAAKVNAPGNDVFDSHDVEAEMRRMEAALVVFNARLANLRGELQTNLTPAEAAPILARLEWVSAAVDAMTAEARVIFSYFRLNEPDQAGKRMATMDRAYAVVNTALAELRHSVARVQQKNFEQQTAAAANLQTFEYVIGVLILLMVSGATFYGHRIARQMRLDTEEKERHLQEITAGEARLRERTLQLERSSELLQSEIEQRMFAQKALEETNERLQALFKHTLEAHEEDRQHIAHELYEEMAQTLVALKMQLHFLNAAPETRQRPTFNDVGTMVDSTLSLVHDLARDLAPHGIEHVGLAGALASNLDKWTHGTGLSVHYSDHLSHARPARNVEIVAYRLIEEAVRNVIAHAHARNLWVELAQEEGELHVHVRDDGVGFDVDAIRHAAPAGKGMGITLSEQRAAFVGGRLEIASTRARGTEVHAILPFSAPGTASGNSSTPGGSQQGADLSRDGSQESLPQNSDR